MPSAMEVQSLNQDHQGSPFLFFFFFLSISYLYSLSLQLRFESIKNVCNLRKVRPRGVGGVEGGRGIPEGGNICILTTDSCCCMAETNIIKQHYYIINQLSFN